MATLSSIPAWEIPRTEGDWWATIHGVTRVGHDAATNPPPPLYYNCLFSSPACEFHKTTGYGSPGCAVISLSVVSDSLGPMDGSPPGSSVCGDSSGKNSGMGCHALLQGNFPTQDSNTGLLHCRRILYQLSYLGRPALVSNVGHINHHHNIG